MGRENKKCPVGGGGFTGSKYGKEGTSQESEIEGGECVFSRGQGEGRFAALGERMRRIV